MMGFGMGFGLLGLVLFWGALILGVVLLVRAVFQSRSRAEYHSDMHQGPTPREILDRRYARGEISREGYELMRADLQA